MNVTFVYALRRAFGDQGRHVMNTAIAMVGLGRCPERAVALLALLVVMSLTEFACGETPGRYRWVNSQTGAITTDEGLLDDCVDTMTYLVDRQHALTADGVEGGSELGG